MAPAVDAREVAARVGRNATARLAAQVGARLLSLVLVALVTRYEGAGDLGRYVLITTLVGLAVAVTDLGLSTYMTREVAGEQSSAHQKLLLGSLLPLRMALTTLGAGALIALVWSPLFPGGNRNLFALGAVSLLPRAATGILAGFVNGRRRMEVSSAIDLVTRLLSLAGAVPALAAGFGIPGVLVCTAVGDAVGILVYGAFLRSWDLLPRFTIAPTAWRTALVDAYPFALTGIIAMAYRRMDIVLLSALQGDAAAGEYGAAYKLWEALGLIPASLLDATFPEMARMARGPGGRSRLRTFSGRAVPVLLIGGVLIAVMGAGLAGPIVCLVYGEVEIYGGAIVAFRLLVWAVPAMFLYLLNGHVLYALGRQRQVTAAMAVVGVMNVALNLLVIPRWSTLGVSVVSLLSALLLWALLSTLARRGLRGGGKGG
jgi:O-antigen/teichoic acid export membrane protein